MNSSIKINLFCEDYPLLHGKTNKKNMNGTDIHNYMTNEFTNTSLNLISHITTTSPKATMVFLSQKWRNGGKFFFIVCTTINNP